MTKSNSFKCQMTKHKIQNKHKAQIPNAKIFVLIFVILILSLFCHLNFVICHSYAQDSQKIEELKNAYFKDKKYTEFVSYLKSLSAKDKTLEPAANYYIALARYNQLKYLEETQDWNEYFGQGNVYRDEITSSAQKTIDSAKAQDTFNIYARLLLWQFHKDQQDAFVETALTELANSVLEYSKQASDIKPIKEVADKLLSYQEKGKAKELYRVYVDKIVNSEIKDDQLKGVAFDFYKEGSLELSQTVYDAYIDRILKSLPKEKSMPVLIDIAKQFAYKNEGTYDALYAEKIFKKIEETGGKELFDEDLMYLRAFNLEKAKEYPDAKDRYVELCQRYPGSIRFDEANYKVGIIHTYILKDIKTGRQYFEKLSQKETTSPQVISSLYQLGLLAQWEGDPAKAKDYYNKLIEKAKDGFSETATLAKLRLKEIDEARPIEYNLKLFLDVSLKEDNGVGMTTNLSASLYILKKESEVMISSNTNLPVSGCMPVELQYLWSGHIGKTKTAPAEISMSPAFTTSYAETGTKEINLVVVSSSGIIDRSIDMVDVY